MASARSRAFRRQLQQLAVAAVGEQVEVAVGSLTHVADLLPAIGEQALLAGHLLAVEREADEVARAVTREIHGQMAPKDAGPRVAPREVDTRVAEAYLKGRYHLGKGTEADWARASGYFEQALAIDSSHALSHSGLADYYIVNDALKPEAAFAMARLHALKAIELDETLPDAQKVRRFLLLTKDLEADDAEMTRTRKVRRRYVAEKYAPVIEAFYGGRDEVELATVITYEDGRQATLQSRVRIEDVHGEPAHV